MALPKGLWFSILVLGACSSGQQSNPDAGTLHQTNNKAAFHYADLYPSVIRELNKKILTTTGNYYLLTQSSDSTVKITWGNDTINRVYDKPVDFMFAERLRIQWDSKDYLILRYGVGSGAWETVAFPLNTKEQVQVFDNGLCFDTKYNLLGTEQFEDTILTVQNLKTQQKQFIIEKNGACDAASNSACIDTISINNKVLYYKWVTPHKYSGKKKRSIEKRILLTI